MSENDVNGSIKILKFIIEEFWQVDCLIRIMKEVLTDKNWEIREGDVETLCNVLVKISEILYEQIKLLKLELEK